MKQEVVFVHKKKKSKLDSGRTPIKLKIDATEKNKLIIIIDESVQSEEYDEYLRKLRELSSEDIRIQLYSSNVAMDRIRSRTFKDILRSYVTQLFRQISIFRNQKRQEV